MNNFSTVSLADYSVMSCSLDQINFSTRCIINTVNQYSYVIAEKDAEFKEALRRSDVLIPDGIGIVVAVRLVSNNVIKKITGSDLHEYFLKKLNMESGSCFYLGSTPETLTLIENKINREYPNIKLETYSPPFKDKFSEDENNKIINLINDFKPDVLFVGMTAPKQEKWTYLHKSRLNVDVICSIGAVFDFYAGTVKRPSKFWQDLGLEWFIRLLNEPRRLFKRYIVYGPVFLLLLFKHKYKRLS